MIAAIQKAGDEVEFTIYPNRGHDAFIPAYENPEMYMWFLQHEKTLGKRQKKNSAHNQNAPSRIASVSDIYLNF